jgi:hypothetical protein
MLVLEILEKKWFLDIIGILLILMTLGAILRHF